MVIDKSFSGADALGKITIVADGKLAVPQMFDQLELDTSGISVAGVLSLGTSACPVGASNADSKLRVVFTGSQPLNVDQTNMGRESDKW